jgi:tetratricopeptide (TPR) repeat protein
MAEGEFALIRHHLEKSFNLAAGYYGKHDLYAMLADVVALQGDAAAIRQYAPAAEELAVRYGHVLYQGIAHRAWGVGHRLAGQYAEAEARLQRALVLFQGLGARWQVGRAYFELGQLAADRRQPQPARDYFTRALAEFEHMGAVPDAGRVRVALASL